MLDEVVIYNIALDALLIDYQTTDPLNDNRKEVKKLRLMMPLARAAVLADLDLNRTARKKKLELTNFKHPHWNFVYRYPANCAKFRKIVSPFPVDNRETLVPSATENIDDVDVICTDMADAYAEIIPKDVNLSLLNPMAGVCVGLRAALLSSALITGKGALDIKQAISQQYITAKAEAMEDDLNENVNTTPPEFESDFVQARLGGRKWRSKI